MKTLSEIEQGLEQVYDGPTFEKNGFTFIPWNEAVKVANKVFGIDGYTVDVHGLEQKGAGYMAQVRVTVYPSDGSPFHRDGIGYNELTGDGGRAHDTAIKGAPSDALNRALKLFGPAFGLNLYDRDQTSAPTKTTPAPRPAAGAAPAGKTAGGKRPSDKQMFHLKKHFTQAQIDGMDFPTWKKAIDDIFAGNTPAGGHETAVDGDDDIPF